MTDPIEAGARAAAQRLAPQHGTRLVSAVEAALQARDTPTPPDTYLDPVALGGLIVSAATLAWTVYTNLRTKTADPSPEVITRTVQVQLRETHTLNAQYEQAITITVQETLAALTDQPDPK
ncbi:MAG: hypothetical protein HOY79_10745 [Streptomyces sp.]|nr:hypothetical protein [Streptomyces sp.]